jgi:hypothetical protein
MRKNQRAGAIAFVFALAASAGCGSDGGGPIGTPADTIGVGAECRADSDCLRTDAMVQHCLTEFKGGYCGLKGCAADADCPYGSACIAFTSTENYCFRVCTDKSECNLNRTPANESNCSSNITFVDGKKGSKACVPPSG